MSKVTQFFEMYRTLEWLSDGLSSHLHSDLKSEAIQLRKRALVILSRIALEEAKYLSQVCPPDSPEKLNASEKLAIIDAYKKSARIYAYSHSYWLALQQYNHVLLIDRDAKDILFEKGLLLLFFNRFEEALEIFNQLLDTGVESIYGNSIRSYIELAKGIDTIPSNLPKPEITPFDYFSEIEQIEKFEKLPEYYEEFKKAIEKIESDNRRLKGN
jgi:tetratricopeptide (TPR) repeat protein